MTKTTKLRQPKHNQRAPSRLKSLLLVTASLVLILGLLGGSYYYFYYLNGPCGKSRVKTSIASLQALLVRWIDEDQTASQAERGELPGHLTALQKLRSEAEVLDVPGCLDDPRAEMIRAMDASIQGYQLFINRASDAAMNDQFQKANTLFVSFSEKTNQVLACAPYCP